MERFDTSDHAYMREKAQGFKQELVPLLRYYTWLENTAGGKASTNYNGQENGNNTLSFPIYDSTLLSFVKEAAKTSFMDKNYQYVYSRNRISTPEQERAAIEKAKIQDWHILCGIFTKYVQGGMTKAYLWSQGVQEGIYFAVISKMKEIVEFWDKPIDVEA